jgi:cellulose biosynthesis protein BcsQ
LVAGKLINQPKNGVELETVIEMLKNIRGIGFSDRLHYMTPTFYFRLVANAAKLTRREIPYKVVLTQVKTGTLVIDHTLKQFQAFNVPLFDTAIASRTIYQTSRFSGETPITAEPQGKAAKEIKALAKEIEVQLSL